ncbi:hypothetical protein [Candidatus Pantoea soli]|uniref:hypothetical protein n=1 Tax=Candidatus Pantoea soli TaxID=3098669 RepID=UPI0011A0883D|nr:hypothetical protein [Pantoea soli]
MAGLPYCSVRFPTVSGVTRGVLRALSGASAASAADAISMINAPDALKFILLPDYLFTFRKLNPGADFITGQITARCNLTKSPGVFRIRPRGTRLHRRDYRVETVELTGPTTLFLLTGKRKIENSSHCCQVDLSRNVK